MNDRLNKLFEEDLKKIYFLLEKRQKEINSYFDILKTKKEPEKLIFIDNFIDKIGLKKNNENRLAVINRLVNLRDDSLSQALQKENFSKEEIKKIQEIAYIWVKDFYINSHANLIQKIKSLKLLTPFYRTILEEVHNIGISMSKWQSKWTSYIINGINQELFKVFNGDEKKIFQMLQTQELLDKGEDDKTGDRSYSVLKKTDNGYKSISYFEAFKEEVEEIVNKLKIFQLKLSVLNDDILNQKNFFLNYLQTLIDAFRENDTNNLIKKWADVDRAWMKITSPLQIGHPLEYYEDHYRKAVALEWDIRITNPSYTKNNKIKQNIESMFKKFFKQLANNNQQNIYENSISNLNKVQLYIGRPLIYYGAEFNGLFSAQVVPNDENVSKELGKKIFAFADNVLEAQKAKPTLKIDQMIFGDNFLKVEEGLLNDKTDLWHNLYNITTIGHEFGHILWMDKESETIMNKSGNFKNIEEFKATTGGLTAFFENEENILKEYVLRNIVKRAITLISWMQTPEVEPYYCEGLIHLDILFESGVLKYDDKLTINMGENYYKSTVSLYQKRYKELAKYYLNKEDATNFLSKFAKKENGYFAPTNKKVKSFVQYYWNLYKDIGRVVL